MTSEEILISLVKNKSLVKYHHGWGYYIEVDFGAIRKIGLIPDGENLNVSLLFANTVNQGRNFYSKEIKLDTLNNSKWKPQANFHLASTFRNLIWFETEIEPKNYIEFWQKNIGLLRQIEVNEAKGLIRELSKKEVIVLDPSKESELISTIFEKEYQYLNVCAGFEAIYSYKFSEIDLLNQKNKLKEDLSRIINQGLSIIGEDGSRFLINNSQYIEGDPPGF